MDGFENFLSRLNDWCEKKMDYVKRFNYIKECLEKNKEKEAKNEVKEKSTNELITEKFNDTILLLSELKGKIEYLEEKMNKIENFQEKLEEKFNNLEESQFVRRNKKNERKMLK